MTCFKRAGLQPCLDHPLPEICWRVWAGSMREYHVELSRRVESSSKCDASWNMQRMFWNKNSGYVHYFWYVFFLLFLFYLLTKTRLWLRLEPSQYFYNRESTEIWIWRLRSPEITQYLQVEIISRNFRMPVAFLQAN